VRVLPRGTQLMVNAYNKTWAMVTCGGQSGFVQLKYLKKLS